MKRILIIGSLDVADKDRAVFETFINGVKQAMSDDATVVATHIEQLSITIGPKRFDVYDENNRASLASFDLIILHGRIRRKELAYVLSRFCAYRDIPYFNDFSAYYTGSKVAQSVVFFENDAPQPTTVFSLNPELLLGRAQTELSLPFVLKDMNGTKGQSNYLVYTLDEARTRVADEPHVQFMAQEFCPNECDYRLLFAPGQALVIARRGGSDTHLNNTSTGASASLANDDVPTAIIQKGRQVATALGLTIAGVDVMQNAQSGDFVFIEINSQPQVFSGALLPEKAAFMTDALKGLLATASDGGAPKRS